MSPYCIACEAKVSVSEEVASVAEAVASVTDVRGSTEVDDDEVAVSAASLEEGGVEGGMETAAPDAVSSAGATAKTSGEGSTGTEVASIAEGSTYISMRRVFKTYQEQVKEIWTTIRPTTTNEHLRLESARFLVEAVMSSVLSFIENDGVST